MLDGGAGESTVAVSFPNKSNIEATLIQQIVEDSIKNISESETGTTSEEELKITIKIEKY